MTAVGGSDRCDRRDQPRPAEVAARAVPWRRRLVRSPVRRDRSFVRSFVQRCGGHENAEPTTSIRGEGCHAHAASRAGCQDRAGLPRPFGPPLAQGRQTGGHDCGPRRLLQCRLFVVRLDQHRGVRADRLRPRGLRAPCVPHIP